MKILALDLGTNTGYCTNEGGSVQCGTWKLATDKEVRQWGKTRLTRRGDPRVCRLFSLILERLPVDVVVFEDCEFSSYTKQTQLWSSLRTAIWMANCDACGREPFISEAVPVGTLKKFATCYGNADKMQMGTALFYEIARKQVPGLKHYDPEWDDNTVDAIWLYLWAQHNLGRIKKP